MCLQEVGGFAHLQQGQTITNDVRIGDVEYVVYVHNTFRAHLATAVAVQVDLEPARPVFAALAAGFLVELFLGADRFLLGSLHLPYTSKGRTQLTYGRIPLRIVPRFWRISHARTLSFWDVI